MMKLPPFTTTGIGSVPETKPGEACQKIFLRELTAPFWPQLPKRDYLELMIPQFSEGLPCLFADTASRKTWCHVDSSKDARMQEFYNKLLKNSPAEFAVSEKYAAGLHAFIRLAPEHNDFLKGQITGPLTFTLGINDQGGTPIYFDPELREAAVQLLKQKALFEIELLKKKSSNVLLSVDEPILAAYGSSVYVGISEKDVISCVNEIITPVKNTGSCSAMHCCGNTDWSLAIKTGIDILCFDAYNYSHTIMLYPDSVKSLFERGGYLAWGIVPTTPDVANETADSLVQKLVERFSLLSNKGISRQLIEERAVLTPACGAGSLDKELSNQVFYLLEEIAEIMRGEK
ncbi:MAG: hypothetical protein ABIH42_10315 [Planctomycetota bacterium]